MEQTKNIICAKETHHVAAETACCTKYELQAFAVFHLGVWFWLFDDSVLNHTYEFCVFHFSLSIEIWTR